MARRKLTQAEQKERLEQQLSKAMEALQAAEARLSDLDMEREKLVGKIKERKIEVEKYQALTKESQYSMLDEMLRLKGINIEDVTKAIANNDMNYLLGLTELKADIEPIDTEPEKSEAGEKPQDSVSVLSGADNEPQVITEFNEDKLTAHNTPDPSAKPAVSVIKTNMPEEWNRLAQNPQPGITEPEVRPRFPVNESNEAALPGHRTAGASVQPAQPAQPAQSAQPAQPIRVVKTIIPAEQNQQPRNIYVAAQRPDMPATTLNVQAVREKGPAGWQPAQSPPPPYAQNKND